MLSSSKGHKARRSKSSTYLYLFTERILKAIQFIKENILISSSGIPLLADFGISRTINSGDFPSLTTSSYNVSGTLRWMASELFSDDNSKTYLLASDVWSYGMTIYVRNLSKYFLSPIKIYIHRNL